MSLPCFPSGVGLFYLATLEWLLTSNTDGFYPLFLENTVTVLGQCFSCVGAHESRIILLLSSKKGFQWCYTQQSLKVFDLKIL
ncbi:hypothetical protein [Bacillus phage Baseball_field]|uniref:Uncharacterized protein n=1 Tax=Bacillus phage Baseball_field TaxID=2756144 RepID=A0A7L7SSC7_9CAUD|nr:hypothetical protein KNV63_gp16 [Bacillus phage Baseball_field]QOC56884.1 hypothetical protein [Bacillus phage Baseball_field]